MSTRMHYHKYAGNPNGNVYGRAHDLCIDTTTGIMWRALVQGSTWVHADYMPWLTSTPSATYATPGDLSMAYPSERTFRYKVRDKILTGFLDLRITPTFTTASGALLISMPVALGASAIAAPCAVRLNVTAPTVPAGYTQFLGFLDGSNFRIDVQGSGSPSGPVDASNMTSGPTFRIRASVLYEVD